MRVLQQEEVREVDRLVELAGGQESLVQGDRARVRSELLAAVGRRAEVSMEERARLECLAEGVARRFEWAGVLDGRVVDDVPVDIQPLRMAAVKEALQALIPESLHASLDAAVAREKDHFGPVGCGGYVCMDGVAGLRARGGGAAARAL